MAAVNVPMFPETAQIADPGTGLATPRFWDWLNAVRERMGGATDKVDQAHTLATNAVPQGTQVIGSGGLQNGIGNPQGALGGNIGLVLYVTRDALANLPTAALNEGDWGYALDGRKPGEGSGAGTGVPCFWSHGAWISAAPARP